MPSLIVEPFKGLRYNPKRVGSLSRVVTPPYDVISPEGQRRYYQRHPQNFVRVVFGKGQPSDTARRNRYSRARQTLEDWIRDGTFLQDPEPSFYPYLQEYTLSGRRYRRWGLVALVRLDSSRILPHEATREAPKRDRYRLLEAVGASLSPIFGLIPDAGGDYRRLILEGCRGQKPVGVAHLSGIRHRLWRNADPSWLGKIKKALRSRELVIADGHHRFEAALAYRQARKKRDPHYSPGAPYNFVMFYLASAGEEEPGLLPTHRLVKGLSRSKLEQLRKEKGTQGPVRAAASLEVLADRLRKLRARGRLGIGLYTGNGSVGTLLEAPARSGYRLDVEWLHQEILPRCVGPETQISYTEDLRWAHRELRRKQAQALFLVQPPPLKEVFRRARRFLKMPSKTTYFYPKPLAGFVEYKFENLKGSDPFRAKGV